ncbi:queuosine precursor transporter [Paroceanicella profunda]|uniref:Probable queuosine precursor transporter n=1 Tax=Paroceanicella profunda TaxID=2579971 RepID=A0A5B8FT53_9RHOB|nr:queuosine precursor transporter [Paroceanicella profunda]QDL91926.1 queuosine precursor transporter [Paroceanicella profunda]
MTRGFMIGILAMALVVVASNILVQFLLGDWLTWGAFTYPFAFLVTDLTNRFLGARAARRVVAAGFVIGVACSLIASQITGPEGYPLTTFRIATASGLAFLLAQMVDIGVFNRLRRGSWWRAPFVSSLAGSSLDTVIFFSVAFSGALSFIDPSEDVSWAAAPLPLLGAGPEVPLWVSLAGADFLVKMALALVALIPFRVLLGVLAARRAA